MKRGPKPKGAFGGERYIARVGDRWSITPEERDFLRRRTLPFLDSIGVERPIITVLIECYLQGLHDAMDVMEGNA
jgi:hypothetical protein